MVKCYATETSILLRATRCFGGVYWHPCSKFHPSRHTNKTLTT